MLWWSSPDRALFTICLEVFSHPTPLIPRDISYDYLRLSSPELELYRVRVFGFLRGKKLHNHIPNKMAWHLETCSGWCGKPRGIYKAFRASLVCFSGQASQAFSSLSYWKPLIDHLWRCCILLIRPSDFEFFAQPIKCLTYKLRSIMDYPLRNAKLVDNMVILWISPQHKFWLLSMLLVLII